MHAEELSPWLHLLSSVSRAGARRLLARHGSPQAVLAAGPRGWADLLPADQVQALQAPPAKLPTLVQRTVAWLDAGRGDEPDATAPRRSILLLGDPDYPAPLLHTADPPLMLYLEGRRELLARRAVAVVGSRKPSPQGEDNARSFAQGLGQAGFCVVSGLAMGIDGAAHEGALHTDGSTIAVLGTGLDEVYPLDHAPLARAIARRGLLISEYFIGTPPLAPNFPQRNRIIAGLSEGCLVVEAAMKSGSLITARMASEAGREVFAIPGSIHAAQSRGCHHLLKQGACLVQELDDLLSELPAMGSGSERPVQPPGGSKKLSGIATRSARSTSSKGGSGSSIPPRDESSDDRQGDLLAEEHPLLRALGHEQVSLEQLAQRTGWPLDDLSATLLDLELEGRIARLPGALFQRRGRG